jgi:hypothetical protein
MKPTKLLISLGLTLISFQCFPGTLQNDSVLQKQINRAKVILVKSLSRNLSNSAVIGDYISIKLQGLDSLLNEIVKTPIENTPLFLVINGSQCDDIHPYSVDLVNQTVVYKLDTTSASIKKLVTLFSTRGSVSTMSQVSISYNRLIIETEIKQFRLYFTSPHLVYNGILLYGVIIALMVLLSRSTNIMRVGDEKTSYSLAQAQLMFWTLIVFISVVYIWIVTGNLPSMPESTLVLLGISVATTAGCKYVDYEIEKNEKVVMLPSRGFFRDILSDNNSTNIHRFQMFIWTVFVGLTFLFKIIETHLLYVIPPSYLYLLGISNGTFTLLKLSEDRGAKKPPTDSNQKPDTSAIPAMG